MRFNIILMVGAFLAIAAGTWFMQRSGPPQHKADGLTDARMVTIAPVKAPAPFAHSGRPAPHAEMRLMDGTVVRLDDYRGKAVVVNFWASWCIPCAVEYPQMVRLASFYPEDLVIVAVSVDADRSAIDRFIARFGGPPANFLIAHDPEKKIAQDVFGTVNLPESYLIDAAQILRDKIIGASVAWDGPEMRARIEALRPAQDAPL